MRYSDELIEEVRSRNDIVDVIGGYVRLKRAGSNYTGLCPFHNEKTPSFSVSRTKQMFYCFGCGAGGNVITFLRDYENYTFQEAVKVLADRAGIALLDSDDPHRILFRLPYPVLEPTENYETTGDVNNVVFPCGGYIYNGDLYLVYGGADKVTALARCPLEDVLKELKVYARADG